MYFNICRELGSSANILSIEMFLIVRFQADNDKTRPIRVSERNCLLHSAHCFLSCSCTSNLCLVKPQPSRLHNGCSPIGLAHICECLLASQGQTSCDFLVMILFRFVAYLMEYVSSMLCIQSKCYFQIYYNWKCCCKEH